MSSTYRAGRRVLPPDEPAILSRGLEDRGDYVDEPRGGLEALELLWTNPSVLDIFPIEAHPTIRSVEEERVDDVDRRAVASQDRISRSTECDCADPGLFPNLHDGPVFRIFATLDVARDCGPLPSEGTHLLAPTDDEDAAPVPENRGHDAFRADVGEVDRSPTPVDDHPISRVKASDVDAVHHRDPRERRADRDDGIRASVHDRRGTVAPLPQAVQHIRAHRAPFASRECEDSFVQTFAQDAGRPIE